MENARRGGTTRLDVRKVRYEGRDLKNAVKNVSKNYLDARRRAAERPGGPANDATSRGPSRRLTAPPRPLPRVPADSFQRRKCLCTRQAPSRGLISRLSGAAWRRMVPRRVVQGCRRAGPDRVPPQNSASAGTSRAGKSAPVSPRALQRRPDGGVCTTQGKVPGEPACGGVRADNDLSQIF